MAKNQAPAAVDPLAALRITGPETPPGELPDILASSLKSEEAELQKQLETEEAAAKEALRLAEEKNREEETVVVANVKPAKLKKYRSKVDGFIMWNGQHIRVKKGDVFTDESHGPDVFTRLTDGGAELEEVR